MFPGSLFSNHKGRLLLPALLLGTLALLAGLRPATIVHAATGGTGKIVFQSDRSGNFDIWVMDADGANPTQLTTDPAADTEAVWSPDGLQIAFRSTRSGNTDVWVMNADGSGQTNLTSDPSLDSSPAWSPNGSQIAFHSNRSGNNDIWVIDADGANPTQLTTDPAIDNWPDWSPNNDQITFTSFRDGHQEIYIMDSDGTNETRLTFSASGFEAQDGKFSPDGSRIAFTNLEFAPPNYANLYVMDADGSDVSQVTTFTAPDDGYAAQWSANGMMLLFSGLLDGGTTYDIHRINADGSGPIENLTNLGSAQDLYADQQPPVRGKIAFSSNRGGSQDIWLMDGDGTNPTQLTTHSAGDTWPIWSPDGARIAFDSSRAGNYDVWVMDADGGNQTNLTNNPANDGVAAWSPDGRRIAFSSNRGGNYDIWLMDADGSNPTQLTTATGGDFTPDWSPDGRTITFMSFRDGHAEIYRIDVDGSNETRLTFSAAGQEAGNPVFSPDGAKIAFGSGNIAPPYAYNVYVMNIDGSDVTQVTSYSDPDDITIPQWSADGQKILYTKLPDGGGLSDVYAINADGSGVPVNLTHLDTADDFQADQQPLNAVFHSATAAGVTGDGLAYGSEDVIMWDGSAWYTWFDGANAGLTPTGNAAHNINAFWLPDPHGAAGAVFSFAQNARKVPGITPKIDGMDLVWWDGEAFSLWFDGQDVGLTNKTQEKIDALHVLPGDASPIGGSCAAYLLISTQGPGKVPNYSGGTLSFGGEDVLGFCATNLGDATTGFWHMVLDGSTQGMPKNSTDSISLSADGNALYLTTKGAFNVDAATGGHSVVYAYDMTTTEFSGPLFVAADEGLPAKVDGLQFE